MLLVSCRLVVRGKEELCEEKYLSKDVTMRIVIPALARSQNRVGTWVNNLHLDLPMF